MKLNSYEIYWAEIHRSFVFVIIILSFWDQD